MSRIRASVRVGRIAFLALLVCLVAGCGSSRAGAGSAPSSAQGGAAQVEPPKNQAQLATLRGDILVDGSSTVYPISQAAAEEFRKLAPSVRTSVGIAGTGGGFKKFCVGETDISDASRPISVSERDACAQNNIEYIEIPVAFDALSVVVSPRNSWAQCMTVAELKTLWEPAAQGRVMNWRQIRSSFPDRPITLFGAGTDSGTFDYFTDAINGKEKDSRGDYQASEDDNVLVQGVSGDENALGYFGFAYYIENPGKLKLVAIDQDGSGKCVEPSIETVKDGSYQPLSRPLFIYVRKEAAARPEVKAFVDFYLSKSYTPLIQSREVGYIALNDEIYVAAAKRFANGTLGTMFPNGTEIGATVSRYLQ
jgi:phosphate transport system substrate-binding protein